MPLSPVHSRKHFSAHKALAPKLVDDPLAVDVQTSARVAVPFLPGTKLTPIHGGFRDQSSQVAFTAILHRASHRPAHSRTLGHCNFHDQEASREQQQQTFFFVFVSRALARDRRDRTWQTNLEEPHHASATATRIVLLLCLLRRIAGRTSSR